MNKHSETGMAEDLIRSIVQTGCAEVHAKTLYEKAVAELENGLIDIEKDEVLESQLNKLDELKKEINALASLRRKTTLTLYNMFNGDKTYWCQVKHLGIAMYTLFEAYEASDNDLVLLDLALEANKQFIKAMTHFLGTEITDCASCFSDAMKAKEKNDGEL